MLELVLTLNRRKNVKIDEVVLVIGADVPCGQWSLEVYLKWWKEMMGLYEL